MDEPTQEDERDEEPLSSDDESDSASSVASEESLVVALTSTSISESTWKSGPSYPPQYLSTAPEYLPPSKQKKQPKVPSDPRDEDPTGGEGGGAWSAEKYENSMETDHVFDRFNARVAAEPEQCVR